MKAQPFSAYSAAELGTVLDRVQTEGFTTTLALVFTSTTLDVGEVQAEFVKREIRICGCSSAGEIVSGSLESDAITGLLIELDTSAFTVWTGLAGSIEAQASELGREAVRRYEDPQILFLTGGLLVDGEDVITGMQRGAGRDLCAFGGMAADDFRMEGTYCFSESDVLDPGIVAIIFDGAEVRVRGNAISGWQPIGVENEITHAEGNVLHEINGQPALEFFNRFFGEVGNQEFSVEQASVVTSQYPLQIMRPEGNLLRAPAMVHPNGTSIVLAGGVRTGDRFRFSIAPGFEVIEETVSFFKEDARQVATAPAAVVMISCKGRHAAFGPMLEDEIEQIDAVYGAPMAGYLSYGEIGAIDERGTALHNDTCCVVSLHTA